MELGNLTDLFPAFLKATDSIIIADRTIEEGEIVASFDNIQVAGLQEIKKIVSANGGWNNAAHVYWETTKELQLQFTQGIFNCEQYAIMNNSNLISVAENTATSITYSEALESDENSQIELKYTPTANLYLYTAAGAKITSYTRSGKIITISTPYTSVIANYDFEYTDGATQFQIGKALTNGFLSFEGRTRVKDDESGQVKTGIIKIPKLKLMSNFSIRLGKQTNPVVGRFNAVGLPVGSRGNTYVCEFYVLEDDIDSDI